MQPIATISKPFVLEVAARWTQLHHCCGLKRKQPRADSRHGLILLSTESWFSPFREPEPTEDKKGHEPFKRLRRFFELLYSSPTVFSAFDR